MRNFVIINGVNSNTINGLGINELPPITKPEMRNIREEIDGRDGDIITNLGYSAYDKTITIGLFGTGYDINNIVAFFNGEGTIVFSNEPDKYYNFKILNQIDYESLQKFRTASITFHCQPFKYPLSETPLEIEYDYIEQEGETLTLNNTGNALMELNLKGNTSQTGTPTPTSPIPVSVVSGDNDVVVCGKNLFDKDNLGDLHGYLYNNTMNISTTRQDRIFYLACKPNTTYTISRTINTGSFRVATYNSSIPTMTTTATNYTCYNEIDDNSASSITITTDASSKYLLVHYGNTSESNLQQSLDTIMVEYGNSASTYAPYTSQTYEVDLPVGLELCKIGTYQDYFTKNSDGEWCKYNAIGKVVLDGSESNWSGGNASTGNTNYTYAFCFGLDNSIGTIRGGYCDKMVSISTPMLANTYVDTDTICFGDTGTARIRLMVLTSRLSSANIAGVKALLSEKPMTCYYVLSSPYLSLIEDNNLIEQLDNLENAMSYEGQTNISQVNNDKAFIISAKALEKGTNEVVVNNIGNVYSKPLLALEGNGNVDIYLDNTQILKANVESKMNIDINTLEAYNPDTMTLLNRQVIGNYNSMTLQPGNNTIRIDGALDKATITNYTRYL